jgi:hypothetical protein
VRRHLIDWFDRPQTACLLRVDVLVGDLGFDPALVAAFRVTRAMEKDPRVPCFFRLDLQREFEIAKFVGQGSRANCSPSCDFLSAGRASIKAATSSAASRLLSAS